MLIPFKKEDSNIFGSIYRPCAEVFFWSKKYLNWVGSWMVVDSGADYTLLPKYYMEELGINVRDTQELSTYGVGGSSKVYMIKKNLKIKLGSWEQYIPVGFLNTNDVPPLFGRQGFMEKLDVRFKNRTVEINF